MRFLPVMVAALLLLTACSSEESEGVDDRDVTTSTAAATSDAVPTTNSPPSDVSRTTTSAPTTTRSAAPTTDHEPEEITTTPPAQTEAAPPPAPPVSDPCTADVMASDLGYDEPLEIFVCESGWAYATYIGGTGDTEFIAQHLDGVWVRVMGMGSPTCQDELLEMGAPQSVVVDVLPCDVMYPPEQPPPADNPPSSDCTIQSELYGTTYADLLEVSCHEARAVWASAATGHPGSWDEAVITADGWECWVPPYDPTSRAAGSCYGTTDEEFTLYL